MTFSYVHIPARIDLELKYSKLLNLICPCSTAPNAGCPSRCPYDDTYVAIAHEFYMNPSRSRVNIPQTIDAHVFLIKGYIRDSTRLQDGGPLVHYNGPLNNATSDSRSYAQAETDK